MNKAEVLEPAGGYSAEPPNGGTQWPWFWLWPAKGESLDPVTKIIRRHHIHEDTLGKALSRAARASGIAKRVTAHTLRHTFATLLLASGTDIRRIQEWLGHNSVETTMIYTHCVPRDMGDVINPIDAIEECKVLPFQTVKPSAMTWRKMA